MVSRTYVNNIIQSMGDMLIVTDESGNIELINKAVTDKLALKLNAKQSPAFWDLVPAEDRGEVKRVIENGPASDVSLETRFITQQGGIIPVNLSC
jgi:PAS domain S-box-containing protein